MSIKSNNEAVIVDESLAQLVQSLMAKPRVYSEVNKWNGRRFYIEMGYPGFNSSSNNRDGYKTYSGAMNASLRYEAVGPR